MKFVKDDSCPECSDTLQWDDGDYVYCENCGCEFEVDWGRLLEEDEDDEEEDFPL